MILKNIDDVEYEDIQSLLDNKITEGYVLDYKECMIDDQELIKHVCAFANSSGGHILIGVKESGEGGYPIAINGINPKEINKERIEQVVLSNIQPRLQIKQKIINNENGNQFLVIQIPQSAYKPHFNNKVQKFFKRFEFQSLPMQEDEISNMYKNRFHTIQDSKEYIRSLSLGLNDEVIQLEIIIVPSLLDSQLIDTTNNEIYDWLNPNDIDYEPSGFIYAKHHGFLPLFPSPNKVGIEFDDQQRKEKLHVYRNGSIHYVKNVGWEETIGTYRNFKSHEEMNHTISCIQQPILAVKLMHVFQFAEDVLSRYNYFGDVEILIKLTSRYVTWGIKVGDFSGDIRQTKMSLENHNDELIRTSLEFERNFPTSYLKTNYSQITSSLMDEIYNCFEIRKCPLFDDKGHYIREKL